MGAWSALTCWCTQGCLGAAHLSVVHRRTQFCSFFATLPLPQDGQIGAGELQRCLCSLFPQKGECMMCLYVCTCVCYTQSADPDKPYPLIARPPFCSDPTLPKDGLAVDSLFFVTVV